MLWGLLQLATASAIVTETMITAWQPATGSSEPEAAMWSSLPPHLHGGRPRLAHARGCLGRAARLAGMCPAGTAPSPSHSGGRGALCPILHPPGPQLHPASSSGSLPHPASSLGYLLHPASHRGRCPIAHPRRAAGPSRIFLRVSAPSRIPAQPLPHCASPAGLLPHPSSSSGPLPRLLFPRGLCPIPHPPGRCRAHAEFLARVFPSRGGPERCVPCPALERGRVKGSSRSLRGSGNRIARGARGAPALSGALPPRCRRVTRVPSPPQSPACPRCDGGHSAVLAAMEVTLPGDTGARVSRSAPRCCSRVSAASLPSQSSPQHTGAVREPSPARPPASLSARGDRAQSPGGALASLHRT